MSIEDNRYQQNAHTFWLFLKPCLEPLYNWIWNCSYIWNWEPSFSSRSCPYIRTFPGYSPTFWNARLWNCAPLALSYDSISWHHDLIYGHRGGSCLWSCMGRFLAGLEISSLLWKSGTGLIDLYIHFCVHCAQDF